MKTVGNPLAAAITASLPAGPLFVLSYAAAFAYGQLPAPIVVDAPSLVGLALLLIPATIVGFFIGFALNLVGATIMSALAKHSETAREPVVWIAAGAGAGALLAYLFDVFTPEGPGFALIATSAACAAFCRRGFDWVEETQA
jgi:hypothetical protein